MAESKTSRYRKGANNSYFGDIAESVSTLFSGLMLTLKHIFQATKRRNNSYVSEKGYFDDKTGLVTLQYPYETLPIPDNGRYRLHNEIDDCIVCDKCAKICPVDCITIESIKATEEIGKTSDGTSKRLYAPTFDIDLAKCCYCGLCTTVCPTECLTMTKVYDFSEIDVTNFLYKFSDLSPEEAEEKRKEAEIAAAKKEAAKIAAKPPGVPEEVKSEGVGKLEEKPAAAKPAFKPKVKSPTQTEGVAPATLESATGALRAETTNSSEANEETKPVVKPVFKPKMKAAIPSVKKENEGQENEKIQAASNENLEPTAIEGQKEINLEKENTGHLNSEEKQSENKPVARPVFRPKIKPPSIAEKPAEEKSPESNSEDSPSPKDSIILENKEEPLQDVGEKPSEEEKPVANKPAARPVFRPKIRPTKPPEGGGVNE